MFLEKVKKRESGILLYGITPPKAQTPVEKLTSIAEKSLNTLCGLDIDALKVVASGVNSLRGPNLGVLLITHYQRLLNYIVPDFVHVMVQGRIVRSGGKELALELEEKGYDLMRDHAEEPVAA